MSFLNKFKKEFEGLNLSERLGQQQGGTSPVPDAHGNNSYQNQYQGQQTYQANAPYSPPQQSYNPGQTQQNPGFQAYTGPPYNGHSSFSGQPYQPPPQQYPGHQPHSPQPPAYTSPPQIQQQQQQQQPWSPPPPPSMASPPSIHQVQSPPAAVTTYGAPPPSAPPCPTPPRWIPHWSEKDQQWYYVETTGRTSWQAPSELPPLAGMPAFPGSLNVISRAPGQGLTHPPQPQYANPQDSRPTLPEGGSKKSSFLAAAGGFTAGGVAGYFVKDRIDKRKAKKRHGRDTEDFADFIEYPAWEVGLDCNVCDQAISGPYAHCKKCDHGDYDICRDCLAQGQTCDGKGKHNLVKVYPKYYCDICNVLIKGEFYYCAKCNNGDWDTCKGCFAKGYTCKAAECGGHHDMSKLFIPEVKFKKNGRVDTSSSSDSD